MEKVLQNGPAKSPITCRRLVTLAEAIEIAQQKRMSIAGHPSQLSKSDKQTLAITLLLEDIGIDGHEYDKGVKAVLREDSEHTNGQNLVDARLDTVVTDERKHVYDHLM